MCEQCSAHTYVLGEVVPGWRLCRARREGNYMLEGDWGLVSANDPDFIWDSKLEPIEEPHKAVFEKDPDADLEPEQWDEVWAFYALAEEIEKKLICDPGTGYVLFKACLDAGYDTEKHGCNFGAWLVDRMGQTIKKWKEDGSIIWDENDGTPNPHLTDGNA